MCACQAPVFGDVNGDGVLEVVLGTATGAIAVLSGISGRDVAPFPFMTHGSISSQVSPQMSCWLIAGAAWTEHCVWV